ncbi:MAG: glycosyltransferase family 4 protein [Woeseiaceae bacterium]
MNNKMHLVYLMSDYPLVTTTFVDREVMMLRQMGLTIDIVASRRPEADVPLSAVQRDIQNSVLYLRPASILTLILSHLYYLVTAPRRLFGAAFYFLTRSHPSIKSRFMTVLHIGRGVYAAYLLRDKEFDELHIHFAFGNAVSGMVVSRLLGKSYTMSIHAGNDIFAYPVMLPEKIMGARHVVTCTSFNKSFLEKVIDEKSHDKITFIPHGLDLSVYDPHPRTSTDTSRPRILSVGTLAERKGFHHLIRACHTLKDRGYNVHCDIVGEGEQRPELEKLISELSLNETVALCGALRHEEVIEKYQNATMFVLPCVQSSTGNMDGIPNVVAEAMAMQLPVVSSRISGVPELVEHDVSGLLTDPGDESAIVDAIARLLDDSELRTSLGDSAYRAIHEQFDVETNTRRLAAILWPHWFAAAKDSRVS